MSEPAQQENWVSVLLWALGGALGGGFAIYLFVQGQIAGIWQSLRSSISREEHDNVRQAISRLQDTVDQLAIDVGILKDRFDRKD